MIGTHILSCGNSADRPFGDVEADIKALKNKAFPALDENSAKEISEEILSARAAIDSIGGVTQTAVYGLMPGLGEPWFDSCESLISHAVFSLGGVKGIEFGKGFAFSKLRGSEANDAFRMNNGKVETKTNNNAGINGGITNGMPVIFQCAVKPTPSIAQPQETIDFLSMKDTELTIEGRHDPAIIRRICPVIDSVTAIVIADMIAQRFGTDALVNGIK